MGRIKTLIFPLTPTQSIVFSISVHGSVMLAAAQAKNLGVMFDFTISFPTSHLMQQQILLALPLEYIWILTSSHYLP